MDRSIPRPGEIYRHFKDKPYQIITVASDSETGEPVVVYQALYGDYRTYVRSLAMFMSEVDHEKYPVSGQQYRFELRGSREAVNAADYMHMASDMTENSTGDKADGEADSISADGKENGEKNKITDAKAEISSDIPNSANEDDKHISSGIQPTGTEVNAILISFLEAESFSKKLEILSTSRKHLTDRLITDMAIALDLAVNEGPLDRRIQELTNCLEAHRRFEDRRLR